MQNQIWLATVDGVLGEVQVMLRWLSSMETRTYFLTKTPSMAHGRLGIFNVNTVVGKFDTSVVEFFYLAQKIQTFALVLVQTPMALTVTSRLYLTEPCTSVVIILQAAESEIDGSLIIRCFRLDSRFGLVPGLVPRPR